jgi:hypothetical protein
MGDQHPDLPDAGRALPVPVGAAATALTIDVPGDRT